jgi:hypothetical protein
MPKRPTAEIADGDIVAGTKPYHYVARKALPYLVRQAKARVPIVYGDLAKEVGLPNARNLNFPLGCIGKALILLGERTGEKIPPIQSIVIKKGKELPSEGFDWFINLSDRDKMSRERLDRLIEKINESVYDWPKWDWVLLEFGLPPLTIDLKINPDELVKYGSGGESARHRTFKEWIAAHPEAVGLKRKEGSGKMEEPLLSGDRVDVMFVRDGVKIAVEVKSIISPWDDIVRGIYQCVKYKAVLEAQQTVKEGRRNCRAILALEGPLPADLAIVKNLLAVEVVGNIQMPAQQRNTEF